MASQNEEYDIDNFQCRHIISEEHRQTIYGLTICQQPIAGEHEDTFLFATCAVNQICVYKHTIVNEQSTVELVQSYLDPDDKEYFYDCKWTTFGTKTILAAGGLRGVVRIIDIGQRCYLKPLRHLGSVNQIAFAGGETKLMVSACSNYTVLLWDAEAALCLANYMGPDQHNQAVLCVDLNYNGRYIVSGGLDNLICLWSTEEKGIKENRTIAQQGPLFQEFRLSEPYRVYFPVFYSDTMHEHYVDSVKWFSEDIILSKSADHLYCIWKFVEGKKEPDILFRWNRAENNEIIFDVRLGLSIHRKLMAIGRRDGSIFVWDVTNLPTQPTILTHRDSKSMIRNIDFTRNGRIFVCSNEHGHIFVWTC